jgi:ElaB/YqjD/DUF883 family membrane-anchored ribosome-binding protein
MSRTEMARRSASAQTEEPRQRLRAETESLRELMERVEMLTTSVSLIQARFDASMEETEATHRRGVAEALKHLRQASTAVEAQISPPVRRVEAAAARIEEAMRSTPGLTTRPWWALPLAVGIGVVIGAITLIGSLIWLRPALEMMVSLHNAIHAR